jgi:DNA-binding NarL/FixJ family response regulator
MVRLVIVDDHEALRDALAVVLGQRGMEVVGAAGNVAAGLDLVEHGEADVALVDIRLPDGSGIDLTRELLARRPDLGVVLYTGHSDVDLLYDGLDAGARGYALKAGSLDELLGAIARVAEGGSYVDPRLDRMLLEPRETARATQLSPREGQIMALMAEGLTAERIGDEIDVSVETVRTHVRNVIRKLQARNRVHAIALALERGEIALGSFKEL